MPASTRRSPVLLAPLLLAWLGCDDPPPNQDDEAEDSSSDGSDESDGSSDDTLPDMGEDGEEGLFPGPCSKRDDIDGNGVFDQRFEWDYDAEGRVIEERLWAIGEFDQVEPSARTTSEYDAEGRIVHRVAMAGDVVSEEFVWMYDDLGREVYHWYWEILHIDEYGGPFQYEDTTTYTGQVGVLERDVDLDGTIDVVRTTTYDDQWRKIAMVMPWDSWFWVYDEQGREIREDYDFGNDSAIDERITTMWNDLDLPIEVIKYEGVSGPIESEHHWTYDGEGHPLMETDYWVIPDQPWAEITHVWNADFTYVEVLRDQGIDGTIDEREEKTYDAAGNQLGLRSDHENDGVLDWESVWTYDCW
jgi:hypothetical protein